MSNHGGVPFDVRNDALMACFGTPFGCAAPEGQEHESREPEEPTSAQGRLAATRAALEMAEMMDVFNAERAVAGLPPLALRIGLASGDVVVGEVAAAPHTRWVCLGEPVRLGGQLQSHAGPEAGHRIWLDAATHSALRGRVATEAVAGTAIPANTDAPLPAIFRALAG